MDFVPYKLLNGTECGVLAAKAKSAAAEWSTAWAGRAVDADAVAAAPAATFAGRSADEADWLAYDAGAGLIYFAGRQRSGEWAARMLSARAAPGAPAGGTLAEAVVDKALEDLAARIAGSAAMRIAAAPPAETWLRHSGAAWIALRDEMPDLIVDARVVGLLLAGSAPPARRGPPVTNPQLGLGRLPVEIDVWLGSAEIELAVFQTLAAGDVIQLDSRIDQPLKVTVAGRNATPRGFLGYTGDRRAIRLTGSGQRH